MVLSIKASEPVLNLEACRMLGARTDIPLHIGVTEAGTLREGVVRSAVGIGRCWPRASATPCASP